MKVLVACEESQIVTEQFILRGHDAMSCDLFYDGAKGLPHYKGDVLDILNAGWDLMVAHPPCTFLTVARNKYFNEKYNHRFSTQHEDRKRAIDFFMLLANAPINKIAIENPIGIMSSVWRKADQVIQPYFFGDKERKGTCLWLKHLPKLHYSKVNNLFSDKTTVEPEIIILSSGRTDSKTHYETFKLPREQRAKARSKTFTGIAKAMGEQWG